MIKEIKRKNLDIKRYSECLKKAKNYLVYAEHWYLDEITDHNWTCLVLDDYCAVMPLPYQRILGFNIISQPLFCQQLGVFNTDNFNQSDFNQFQKKLHQKIVRGYHFNEDNTQFFSPKGVIRINQILEAESLLNELNENRKREIKKLEKSNLSISRAITINGFISLLNKNYKSVYAKIEIVKILRKLLNEIKKNGVLEMYSLKNVDNVILAYSVCLKSKNRLILLCSARDKINEIKGMYSYLLYHVILNHHNFTIDFEGSMLKGVQILIVHLVQNQVNTPYIKV